MDDREDAYRRGRMTLIRSYIAFALSLLSLAVALWAEFSG